MAERVTPELVAERSRFDHVEDREDPPHCVHCLRYIPDEHGKECGVLLRQALDEARAHRDYWRDEGKRLVREGLEALERQVDRANEAEGERDEARAEAQALVEEVAKLRAAARDAFWFLTGTWDGKRMQSQSDVTGALAQALASREGPKGGAGG